MKYVRDGGLPTQDSQVILMLCKNLIKNLKNKARGKKLLNGAVSYKRKLQIWSFLAFFDVKGAFIRMMNAQKIHPYVISS